MAGLLKDEGADALALTQPDSIAWLLNVRGADVPFTPFALSFAVLGADGAVKWFVDGRKLTEDARAGLDGDVEVLAPDALGAALDELGARGLTVRADPATAAQWIHARLTTAGAKVQRKDDPCQLAKARKNLVQQAGMRAAHERDGAAVVKFLAWLAEQAPGGGVGEIAAADALEGFRREHALFRGLSFPTISGAGPNGAIVHYRVTPATERALEPGSLYLVDSGAQYPDGTTDITRTLAIGTPSPDMRRHFTLVLKGHIGLARAVFPKGTSGSQLDVLARGALWRNGLDYDHGTGHGVGSFLSVHEGPQRISKMPNSVALEPGMVISNEPGYYLSGAYGIRIENLVQVTKAPGAAGNAGYLAFETLTLAPIDRNLIAAELLDAGRDDARASALGRGRHLVDGGDGADFVEPDLVKIDRRLVDVVGMDRIGGAPVGHGEGMRQHQRAGREFIGEFLRQRRHVAAGEIADHQGGIAERLVHEIAAADGQVGLAIERLAQPRHQPRQRRTLDGDDAVVRIDLGQPARVAAPARAQFVDDGTLAPGELGQAPRQHLRDGAPNPGRGRHRRRAGQQRIDEHQRDGAETENQRDGVELWKTLHILPSRP